MQMFRFGKGYEIFRESGRSKEIWKIVLLAVLPQTISVFSKFLSIQTFKEFLMLYKSAKNVKAKGKCKLDRNFNAVNGCW